MKKKTAIALITGGVVVFLAAIFFFLILPLVNAQQEPIVGLQTENGSIYYYDEAGMTVSGWQTIDGKLYYFDPATGKAVHGWYTDEQGNTYYFGPNGYALTGQQELGGTMYNFDDEGRLVTNIEGSTFVWQIKDGNFYCVDSAGNYVTGLQDINGSLYYFNGSGIRQSGWHTIDGKLYFFSETDGRAAKGWYFSGGNTYYFCEEGYALTGQQTIDGEKYTFGDDGKLIKTSAVVAQGGSGSKSTPPASSSSAAQQGGGQPAEQTPQTPQTPSEVQGFKWVQRGNDFYYEDGNGNRKTGLTEIEGNLYYFNNDGVRQSGLQELGGKKYYFATDGKAVKGWQQLAGNNYYFGEQWFALTGLQKIGNDQYYFSASAERLAGWQEIEGKLYHFDAGSGKAVKGWFTTSTPHTRVQQQNVSTMAANTTPNQATYYFGPDGFALKGVVTIENKIYYLDDSYMRQTGWLTVGGKLYCFSEEEGSAVTGWSQLPEEGGKCYLSPETGYVLTGLQNIPSEGLYYFNLEGALQTGWRTIEGKRYYFDEENGRAVAEQFKQDETGAFYYLGKEGYALTGLQNLPDGTFYFDTAGVRQTGWQQIDGKHYFFDAGASDAAVKNNWMQREGQWCFLGKEGYSLVGLHAIDGATYFFDANGLRQTEWQTWEGKLYYLGRDGKAVTGWQTLGGSKYYFAEDCHACVGPVKIGEAWYFFDEKGAMQTGWQTHDGKIYLLNPDGTAKVGWYREGENRYYFDAANGHALVGEHKIEDITYTFDEQGRVIDEKWANYTWRTDEETGNKYFSGEDGRFVTGLFTIQGELYYFNEKGVMQTGQHTIDEKFYWFAENGAARRGWAKDDKTGATYYFDEQGSNALTGLQSIEGDTYYFNTEGAMQTGWHTIGQEQYYFSAADGKAPKGIFDAGEGKIYLFGNNGYALKGLQKFNDKLYFANDECLVQTGLHEVEGGLYYFAPGEYAAASGWQELEGKTYYFTAVGYAQNGLATIENNKYYFKEYVRQTGWQVVNGNRYFFAENGAAKTGWFTDDATQATYYFGADHYALIGVHVIEGIEYHFNQDGVLIKTETPTTNTWVTEGDETFYLDENGEPLKGLHTVGGNQYYFNEETGAMQTGWVILEGQRYYFGKDGKGLTGWQTIDSKTYYFGIAGFAVTGEQTINGTDYTFDENGVLLTEENPDANEWVEEDGKFYYINSEGQKATGLQNIGGAIYFFDETGARQRGKITVDGKHYYFGGDDDQALKGWQQIESRWYVFDVNTGVQLLGWQYRALQEGGSATHYYNEDGTSPQGWVEVNGIERYFFPDGQMAIGWQTLDGKTYYFQTSGLKATGQLTIDGTSHFFNEEGHLMTGWQTESGKRYYFTIEGACKGWAEIDGRWYLFDLEEGYQLMGWQYRQLENNTTHTYYYNETTGELPKAGFGDVNGTYRYIYEDGHMAIGWQTIESNRYYFDTNGALATGWQTIGDVQYCFSDSGVLQVGWQTATDGNRYYFTADGAATGWQKIENRWYVFNSAGAQQVGWQTRENLKYYYYADGSLPAAGWVENLDGAKRYVHADGQLASGWTNLEDGRYYFKTDGVPLTGWQQIESRWYTFSKTGLQQTDLQEKQVTGGSTYYYYYENGTLPKAGWVNGITLEDGALRRYVLADGSLAQGWQKISSYTYYFTKYGAYLTGRHEIDGRICVFDTNGYYIAPPSITAVNYETGWNNPKTVTVTGAANAQLKDKTLQYSFDRGVTWQTSNAKSYAAGTTIPAGTIRIRDSVGNVVIYNAAITLQNSGVAYGIDVSSHQGLINWQAVKASGVQFAIIRSLCWDKSTNNYRIDPYFDYNVRNAKANGIKVGTYLYSYAYSKAEMLQEVQFFLNSAEIKNMLNSGVYFDLPVYIDYEDPLITKNTANLTIGQRTEIVRYGMQVLEQGSKYKFLPGFYTYYNFAKNVIDGAQLQREGYEFWLARYNSAHGWSPAPPIWQYSSTGKVPGINTNVDLNYCYKDYSNINGGATPAPVTTHNLTVTNQNGQVVTAPAATILAQIVQNEVGGFNNAEVYKAQAVAAQSWILYQNSQGYAAPRVSLKTPTAAVQNAVNQVVTQTLYYQNQVAFTPYYAYSAGTTNNGAYWGNNLPYLKSVTSPWDTAKGAYTGQISNSDLKARLEAVYGAGITNGYAPQDWIKIEATNAAGYVTRVSVCGRTPTVDYFYQTIVRHNNTSPIRSPHFTASYNGNGWTFVSRGWGHCVGMSQTGAAGLAAEGKTYTQILAHYFPGTKIVNI